MSIGLGSLAEPRKPSFCPLGSEPVQSRLQPITATCAEYKPPFQLVPKKIWPAEVQSGILEIMDFNQRLVVLLGQR